MALEAAESDRVQADGKQGHGAGDGQGDTGGGRWCPARRGGGDDKKQAGGEERAREARGGAVAGDVLCEGVDAGRRFDGGRIGAKDVPARWLKAGQGDQEGEPGLKAASGVDGQEALP